MSVEASGEHVAMRPRRRASLSIKSLLLLMLLAVSIGSNVVVGVIGYLNGTESLKDAAYDRLIEVRDSRSREVRASSTRSRTRCCSPAATAPSSMPSRRSPRACAELNSARSRPMPSRRGGRRQHGVRTLREQEAELVAYFADDFGPALEEATGEPADASQLPAGVARPRGTCSTTTRSRGGSEPTGSSLVDAGDGSAWSAAHAEFHDYLRRMADAAASSTIWC